MPGGPVASNRREVERGAVRSRDEVIIDDDDEEEFADCATEAADNMHSASTSFDVAAAASTAASMHGRETQYLFSGHWLGTRNDLDGHVGISFVATVDLFVLALGRHVNDDALHSTSEVVLWSTENMARLASVDVGPQSSRQGNYAYTPVRTAIAIEADKEYRLTQACTHGMDDFWFDGVITEEEAASHSAASFVKFLGAVHSEGNVYPSIFDGPRQRAGAVNIKFDVADADGERSANQFARRKKYSNVRQESTVSEGTVSLAPSSVMGSSTSLESKAGWLYKARPGWIAGWTWTKRWCVLRDNKLKWYRSVDDKRALGVLDFNLVTCEVERLWSSTPAGRDSSSSLLSQNFCSRSTSCDPMQAFVAHALKACIRGASFRISPIESKRAFEFQVETREEGEAWVNLIVQHIRRADAGIHLPSQLQVIPKKCWWKVNRISPSKFQSIANTGDVLLFRSLGTMPKIIRAAAKGGRYDHVALILKLHGGKLALLEATGNEGVGLVNWDEFMGNGWPALYPEMALRRVHCERTAESITALQEWCMEVIGRPYRLTIEKLRRRNSASTGGERDDQDFFCSQLVAEALKVFGVIPRGISSTQFWPSTFSATHRPPVATADGYEFDDEDLTIDFNLDKGDGSVSPGSAPGKGRDITAAWQ